MGNSSPYLLSESVAARSKLAHQAPIVFETYGAAVPTTLEHMSLVRHQYGNVVLPCEDKPSESIIHST